MSLPTSYTDFVSQSIDQLYLQPLQDSYAYATAASFYMDGWKLGLFAYSLVEHLESDWAEQFVTREANLLMQKNSPKCSVS